MLTESYSGGVGLVSYEPYPPMGFVFAYQSEVQQFETFKRWFTPTDPNEAPNFPTAVGCLDQGLVRFKNNQPQVGMQPEGWAIPLVIPLSASNVSPITDPDENYTYNGITYPVKKVLGDPVAIDQSRVLLLFVLYLNEMLSYKKLNPAFSFMDQYMTDEMKLHLLVE